MGLGCSVAGEQKARGSISLRASSICLEEDEGEDMFYTQENGFFEQIKDEKETNFAFIAFAKTFRETRIVLKDRCGFKRSKWGF